MTFTQKSNILRTLAYRRVAMFTFLAHFLVHARKTMGRKRWLLGEEASVFRHISSAEHGNLLKLVFGPYNVVT